MYRTSRCSLKTVLLEKGTLSRVDVYILKCNFDVHDPLHPYCMLKYYTI